MKTTIEILLVEDDPKDVELIMDKLLKLPNFNTITTHVSNLQSAKTQIERFPFQLIILDLSLPDSDGLKTIKAIQAITSTKILIFTGATMENEILIDNNIKGFMPKSKIVESNSEIELNKQIEITLATDEIKSTRQSIKQTTENLKKVLDDCVRKQQDY